MLAVAMTVLIGASVGCQSVRQKIEYWKQNDHRVGPNYSTPAAPVAESFSQLDSGIVSPGANYNSNWWEVFNDPELNLLIDKLRSQNLSLKAACHRIDEARLQRNIAAANLFPQNQRATGSFSHTQLSRNSGTAFPGTPLTVNDWSRGFDASWEVDLWGRIRRSIDAADAVLESRIHDRDFAMVSLIGDSASLYIQIRSFDERIELAKKNVELQEGSLKVAKARFKEGRTSKLDVVQAESNLASTKSLIPQFELARRQLLNALAVLLGVPPSSIPNLSARPGTIPEVPSEVIVGIPAELIGRRPDIRAAERSMAAQFEQIGISEAALYPTFAINGQLGWQAARLSDLFQSGSFNGTIAPGFSWNILNYGRLKNAICVEEARFKQIQLDFENTVLSAQREVEDGIIEFIKRKEQYEFDLQTTEANEESVELAIASFKEGKTDFGRVFVVQTNLVSAQDRLVETRASIALALVNTYRALGGGWQLNANESSPAIAVESPPEIFVQDRLTPINAEMLVE
jgi:NodT family efflux transporter outer membrane factor (OMF) lipoprotein